MNPEKEKQKESDAVTTQGDTVTFADFAGSAACVNCHKDIYKTHLNTAHFRTSAEASGTTILGNFHKGKNSYSFGDNVVVAMEKRDSGYYQVEYVDGFEKRARRIDITVGSGTMGQSTLSWQNDHLFQMPITYFSAANEWSNSPGFPNRAVFNRVITSRCLECHSTFVETISPPGKEPEQYDRTKFIYGVDCEKCHGAAAEHVRFQTAHPDDTTGKFILNPGTFTRQQKLDLCALCHGGRLQKTKPSFQYIPGKNLWDYFLVDTLPPHPEFIDVHGNQYGLLRASKCFKMSDMTCNSCHDVHRNEKGKTALFSQRCMSCHSDVSALGGAMHRKLGGQVKINCVDCHMPLKPSRAISVFLPGEKVPTAAQIRSHFIK
ncbi:MAG: hypothetical protein JNK79_02730 [Chitinophagaceae bacterium]|nr:hypothetical protein [Chitinophagaceae bacterium]